MPKGKDYGKDLKQLMFRIINFVENEKNGPVIPLFNTTDRLEAMLGISKRSILRLRCAMVNLKEEQKEDEDEDENEDEDKIKLRRRTVSETSVLEKRLHRKRSYVAMLPVASSPKKKDHSGRKSTQLTEQQQDNIRYNTKKYQIASNAFFA
jgi:hypothetical protein